MFFRLFAHEPPSLHFHFSLFTLQMNGINKVSSQAPELQALDTGQRALPVRALTERVLSHTEDLPTRHLLSEFDASDKLDDPALQQEVEQAPEFLDMQEKQRAL